MARYSTFRFTVVANEPLARAFAQHFGARRFAYNQCLAAVKGALDEKKRDFQVTVPWSAFSLINSFNSWKRSEGAGRLFKVSPDGEVELASVGLSWRNEVCAQVFEEAAVDLSRSLAAFSAAKKNNKRVGFPHFQKKGRGNSFRLRNKVSPSGTCAIRVGSSGLPRTVVLPVIGSVKVREDTRRLRRLLKAPANKICSATVCEHRGRFVINLTCELGELHPEMRHDDDGPRRFVGVDVGLANLVVAANAEGEELARVVPARAFVRALPKLQRRARGLSRKKARSRNRQKAAAQLKKLHHVIADQRHDHLLRLSSALVKSHDALCLEGLAIHNMVQNRHLARAIGDASWGELRVMIAYKAKWRGATFALAPRFFPSTKRCSSCGYLVEEMALSERLFCCRCCALLIDRDLNAAINLAAWANAAQFADQAPNREARGRVNNACGARSAGHLLLGGETPFEISYNCEQKQEPATAASSAS